MFKRLSDCSFSSPCSTTFLANFRCASAGSARPPDEVVAKSLMCCCFGRSPFDSRNRKQFGSTLPSSSRWQDVKIECSHPITRSTLTESIATLEPGDKHMESQGTLKSSMPLFSLAINHSWMFLAPLKRSLRHRPKYSERESWSSQTSYFTVSASGFRANEGDHLLDILTDEPSQLLKYETLSISMLWGLDELAATFRLAVDDLDLPSCNTIVRYAICGMRCRISSTPLHSKAEEFRAAPQHAAVASACSFLKCNTTEDCFS